MACVGPPEAWGANHLQPFDLCVQKFCSVCLAVALRTCICSPLAQSSPQGPEALCGVVGVWFPRTRGFFVSGGQRLDKLQLQGQLSGIRGISPRMGVTIFILHTCYCLTQLSHPVSHLHSYPCGSGMPILQESKLRLSIKSCRHQGSAVYGAAAMSFPCLGTGDIAVSKTQSAHPYKASTLVGTQLAWSTGDVSFPAPS